MAMRGSCTICTDFFGNEQNVSATFCGHLFHEGCLAQWLNQCGTLRTCPQCRTKLTAKQVIPKLFINVPESYDDEVDPFHLKNELSESQMREQKLKNDKTKLKETVKNLQEEMETLSAVKKTLKKDLKASKHSVEFLQERLKLAEGAEQEATAARNEAKELREKLKTCERMEFILDAEKHQVSEMMDRFSKTSDNISPTVVKEIATFCVSLKQEYESMKVSRNNAKLETMKLKKSVHQLKQLMLVKDSEQQALKESMLSLQKSEEQLTDENRGLRQKLEALQNAIASPSDTKASAISRLVAESPAPIFITPETGTKTYRKGVRRDTIAGESSSPILPKRPKLTPSPTNENVVDLCDENESPFDSKSSSHELQNWLKTSNDDKRFKTSKVVALRESTNFDSPGTSETKRVCEEFGLKFVKTTSSKVSSSSITSDLNFPFFKPKSMPSGGLSLKRSQAHKSSSKRINKVPLSSKAKPFTSKPTTSASLRPSMSLIKKCGPR